VLAESPRTAFRWETPAVMAARLATAFQFALIERPGLTAQADPHAFASHFADPSAGAVAFPSMGADAILVAPTPLAPPEACAHLAVFTRMAPIHQQHALWQQVGRSMAGRVGERPVWLSTAGAGVAWLHARLDDRPKYDRHAAYRQVVQGKA
jgi:hypothetical protein